MKNNTRKILLALLLTFVMLVSMVNVTAFAADEGAVTETKTYYFSNNKGWSAVNVYYWGGESTVEWPGATAECIGNNEMGESVYSVDVPADVTYIIFNDGTSQTVDIQLDQYFDETTKELHDGFYLLETQDDKGHWEVGSYAFNPDNITSGGNSGSGSGSTDTPDVSGKELAVGDYYLAGYINGADYGIESDAANLGSYKFVNGKLSVEFTQTSYVIVKNSSNTSYWTQSYVGSGNSATYYNASTGAGEKMLVPGGKVTFTLYKGDGDSFILTYTVESGSEIEVPTIDETDTVTVYAGNSAEWDTVYFYCWVSGGAEYATWPGLEMEMDENGYWYAEVPKACDNIIFNNGQGGEGNQTLDLKTPTGDKNVCDIKGCIKYGTNSNINSWFSKSEYKPPVPVIKENTDRNVTLVVKNTENWSNVFVYFWSSENVAGTTWPGIELQASADGLYYAVIPEGNYYVIFNNGQDGEALVQTANLVIPTDDNVLYDNAAGSWSEMYLEANHPVENGSDGGSEAGKGMTFLQQMAFGLLMFLRTIESFFKSLFGG